MQIVVLVYVFIFVFPFDELRFDALTNFTLFDVVSVSALVFISHILLAIRLYFLSRVFVFGIPSRPIYLVYQIIKANYLGSLATIFVPTSLGGDLTRGYALVQIININLGKIFFLIISDRGVSLIAVLMILLVGISLLDDWHLHAIESGYQTHIGDISFEFIWMFLIFFFVLTVIFILRKKRDLVSVCSRVRRKFYSIIINGAFALIFSISSIFINIFALYYIIDIVDIVPAHLRHLILSFPATMCVNMIPLTPNGLGIGESFFGSAMIWLDGDDDHGAFVNFGFCFLIWRFLTMAHSLIGLLFLKDLFPVDKN